MTKNEKRLYVWKLASFLVDNGKTMSGEELASHLTRNGVQTDDGSDYVGKRGSYTFVKSVYNWLHDDLGLKREAAKVAKAFKQRDGRYAYEVGA